MRILILATILGMALPAFAADEPMADGETAEETAAATAAATESAPVSEPAPAEGAPAAEPELAEAAAEMPPVPASAVARGMFATGIEEREPVDSITSLGNDRSRVYYFTEIVGVTDRELTHRWEYRGEVVAEVPIVVGGPRWRTYSSKNLDPSWLGEWKVTIVDESGAIVHTDTFVYEAAAPAPEVADTEPMPSTNETTAATEGAAPAESPEMDEAKPAAPAPVTP